MIDQMKTLLVESEVLLNFLKQVTNFNNNRNLYLAELKVLLNQRQTAIDAYQWARIRISTDQIDFNEEEQELAKRIVEIDKEIVALLKLRTNQHQQERRNHFLKGKSMVKYISPHTVPTRDGVFFDKKK